VERISYRTSFRRSHSLVDAGCNSRFLADAAVQCVFALNRPRPICGNRGQEPPPTSLRHAYAKSKRRTLPILGSRLDMDLLDRSPPTPTLPRKGGGSKKSRRSTSIVGASRSQDCRRGSVRQNREACLRPPAIRRSILTLFAKRRISGAESKLWPNRSRPLPGHGGLACLTPVDRPTGCAPFLQSH
jgi:hypothetical protein